MILLLLLVELLLCVGLSLQAPVTWSHGVREAGMSSTVDRKCCRLFHVGVCAFESARAPQNRPRVWR